MQILLGAVLVFAVLWFVALKPKTAVEEPIAAEPAPAAQSTPPASAAGGETASTGLGKAVESANNVAAKADATSTKAAAQTGEETPATSESSSPASADEPKSGSTASGTAKPAATTPAAAKAKTKQVKKNVKQAKADQVIRSVERDLAARRAVVVLVYSPSGKEDKILQKRVKSSIDRRGGRVRTYFINVTQVGYYDGLLAGLNLSQTPSTIVIAPNNEAKVLGGLTSTERIDRLTSSAVLTPVATTP